MPLIRRRSIQLPPTAVLILAYLVLIAVGTILLMLPLASHQTTGWSDALFTATSAATVTGLVVLETGSHFTLFGQIVILLLIQLGGLGIVTFAVLILCMLGQPISLQHKLFLREELNQTSTSDLLRMALVVLRVVVLFELAGTLALAWVFVPEFGWAEGLWQALFHTISAFNNAGFGLFSDSLVKWSTHPLVNLIIPLLFVIGGLGFSVLTDLRYARRWNQLSLHSKMTLSGTLALMLLSAPAFTIIEWHNPETLGAIHSTADKLMAGSFQALTTRTAGFNTLDIGKIEDASALMMILLMLIGGGSVSTAGGIKVTTFVVMVMAAVSYFRRRSHPVAFGRSLGSEEIMKALSLVSMSLAIFILAAFVLTLTQRAEFLDLLFEVASAFGTVGLSMGVTEQLDGLGRAIIMSMMLIGRLGPLALALFLATRQPPRIRYPAGQIFLG